MNTKDLFTSNYSSYFNLEQNRKGLFSSNNEINKPNNIFSNINNNINDATKLFSNINLNSNNNQEDEEHCCVVIKDELSLINEENESVSGTESALKSRKNSQLNLNILKDNLNINEEKKKDEFLKPLDVIINNKNEHHNNTNTIVNHHQNNSNNISNNNYQLDFEDEVNKQYGLFPIV